MVVFILLWELIESWNSFSKSRTLNWTHSFYNLSSRLFQTRSSRCSIIDTSYLRRWLIRPASNSVWTNFDSTMTRLMTSQTWPLQFWAWSTSKIIVWLINYRSKESFLRWRLSRILLIRRSCASVISILCLLPGVGQIRVWLSVVRGNDWIIWIYTNCSSHFAFSILFLFQEFGLKGIHLRGLLRIGWILILQLRWSDRSCLSAILLLAWRLLKSILPCWSFKSTSSANLAASTDATANCSGTTYALWLNSWFSNSLKWFGLFRRSGLSFCHDLLSIWIWCLDRILLNVLEKVFLIFIVEIAIFISWEVNVF